MAAEGRNIPKKVVATSPEIFVFRHGVEFVVAGRVDEPCFSKKLLDAAAHVISTANLFLAHPIKQVRVVPSPYLSETRLLGKAIASKEEGLIEFARKLFENALADKSTLQLEVVAWHEAAHVLYAQHGRLDISISYHMMMRQLSDVFEVFNESTYFHSGFLYGTGGHPASNPHELFASASVVLRFFPGKFMENVAELKSRDKALAIEAAQRVGRLYLENPRCPKDFFDPELVKFLGLEARRQPAAAKR